ncbi:MAG: baeRF10 domain-containing protein [Conexibacter sp.]
MTPPAVGNGTLRRLGTIGEDGHAVLSVYLDLDPARFATPAARETELDALLAQARRDGAEEDAERVRALIEGTPELLRGGRGLAVFSCAAAGTLESVTLPEPVEPLAVVDDVPWLEPLVTLVTAENWGVAVLSRRGARLFRGGRRGLVEFATVADDVHGRHQQGGWSQARYQRGFEEEVADHVRHTVAQLQRAHRRRPFEQFVAIAAAELWPVVEAQLPAELRDRLAGHVEHDLEHATTDEIADAIVPVVERAEQLREQQALARLEQALATGGPAAAGVDEVRALLEQRRVALLLVPEGPRENGLERLIADAAGTGVETLVVRHAAEELRAHGPVAALLHW